ncbi:hypothetical protein NM688_g3271 [Phlebia brevispora]|uniref:Uncharacterized protein n=1 Tax=Phlebia brevispora TaxID=194682 RepID=A0ACC1T6W2_9APHY|nr:hypothetical protein NM688_g3271 [Phlebia brevispora]
MHYLLLGLTVSLGICSSHAVSLPFTRRDAPHSTSVNITAIEQSTSDPFHFLNRVAYYAATVYIQGQPYVVQLDTGSADLWIGAEVDNWIDTGYNGSIRYVDTSVAAGPIGLANVTFGDFTIPAQALLSAPGSNASTLNRQGLLGLANNFQSEIFKTLRNSSYSGITVLDHIFSIYPNESNFISFLLTRNEIGTTGGGVFTIGETVQQLSDITTSPKLPVFNQSEGAWLTLMDAVEINGVRYSGNSSVQSVQNTSQVVVVLDSGTTEATAPPYYVDAMYKDIPGATFDENINGYYVPCDTKTNISMVFGNYTYPMHPIDAINICDANVTSGALLCCGTFSYNSPDGVDFILGDAFLRNVYSLYDYGNWATVGTTDPYMQILSITDPDEAWLEFDSLIQGQFEDLFIALFNLIGSGSNGTTTVTVTESVTASVGAASATAVWTTITVTANATSATGAASTLYSSSSTASTSVTAGAENVASGAEDLAVQGALSENDSLSSQPSDSDTNTLIRNSWILIGLISGAIVLILGLLVKQCISRGSKRGYSRVEYAVPAAVDKPYSAEASYSDRLNNPYSDIGHGEQ